MAFNAKSLTYDKSEPAFLQRIKAGFASQDGRSNVQQARSGKSRLKMGDGDEDDGPVIVDESGEIVERRVFEGMMKGDVGDVRGNEKADGGDDIRKEKGHSGDEKEREKQKVVEAGVGKKRKAVKVIGGDDVVDVDEGLAKQKRKAVTTATGESKRDTKKPGKIEAGKTKPNAKQKAKKIKLSFEEPE